MKTDKPFLVFIALITILGGAIGYFVYENSLLKDDKLALENEIYQTKNDFSATTDKLNGDIEGLNVNIKNLNAIIDSTKKELASTTVERNDFETKYKREKKRMDGFNSALTDIQGKVGTLEKLEATDPELLKKYSKIYFLNENYVPKSFVKIDTDYTISTKEDYLFNSEVWPFLEDMMAVADADGIDIKIISAYRSFGAQSSLKSTFKVIYGSGANKFSADQGYSEHQLGTTVDLTTPEIGSSFVGFDKTPAFQWLQDNAYTYGFILSYPEGNQYYQYEPWHWRFVGRKLAEKLREDNKNFYDLDQREIDQYLISFFD